MFEIQLLSNSMKIIVLLKFNHKETSYLWNREILIILRIKKTPFDNQAFHKIISKLSECHCPMATNFLMACPKCKIYVQMKFYPVSSPKGGLSKNFTEKNVSSVVYMFFSQSPV